MVGRTAFLFPGQGSQRIGMGKAYFETSAAAKNLFERADSILGFSLTQLLFEGPEDKLKETQITQPGLFVVSAAALECLKERGITPAWVAGHSLGEYSALYASGVFSFEDGLKMVYERGVAMQAAGLAHPGTMAAILGLPLEALEKICLSLPPESGPCVAANLNSESQIVISGTKDSVARALEECKKAGALKCIPLNVAGAYHSPLMKSAAERMATVLGGYHFSDAQVPVITNVDAQPTLKAADFKQKLVKQIEHAVRWDASMKFLIGEGAQSFIEVGSGNVLRALIKKLDRTKTVFSTDENMKEIICV